MAGPELERLLEVQQHDTHMDQLEHRRQTLPERTALADLDRRLAELDTALTEVGARLEVVARRQADLEAELEAVERRTTELDRRMYSGEVGAARDLQVMADEIRSLKRRRSTLEDSALEAMEERDPLESEVDQLRGERAAADAEHARLEDALAAAEAAVGDELAQEQKVRAEAAATVPPALLDQYERIRARADGIGAARLAGSSCSGCHLSLSATEFDRLKKAPPDAVVTCEQCGRILVR